MKENSLKINVYLYVFLFISIIAFINDIIIYFLKFKYNIALAISAIIVFIFNIVLIKKNKIKIENNFEKKDLLFLIPYILINSILFLSCDEKLDTYNYHIYIQKNFFNDKINFDYVNYRHFFFPLGDRMSYIFRYFLGYRLGTLLSFYTLIVLFYQMKDILKKLFPKISYNKILFFSSLVLLTFTPNWRSASYHIDNFSIIILLEIIYVFIKNENILINKKYLYYISLIAGIATAIKITNLIIAIPIILIMIIQALLANKRLLWKKIKILDIILCFVLFFTPFIIYMLDNYLQTKNPVFPFYNNIFKSEFYNYNNGKDTRFGMPSILYAIIWPIIVTINPLKGFDFNIADPLWGCGYIICIINLIFRIKNKDIIWKLSFIGFIESIIWAIFLMGYTRYGLVLPVLFYIVIVCNIIETQENIRKNKNIIFPIVIFWILIIILIYSISTGIYVIFFRCIESYENRIDFSSYSTQDNFYEIDGVWGSIAFNSGIIDLIRNPQTPIYNLDINRDVNNLNSSDYSQLVKDNLYESLKNERIFTITTDELFIETLECLENDGFILVADPIKYVNSKFQNRNNYWYILEIRYIKN